VNVAHSVTTYSFPMDGDHTPPLRVMEKLDMEGEEERQNRIQSTLEKLNSTSTKKPSTFPPFNFGNSMNYDMKTSSELLSRVQAFLPEIEESNSLLAQRLKNDPKSVDIEHMEEGTDQYIEMNLGLGVFEDRTNIKGQEIQDADMSSSSTSESSESEEDSDVDTDSSSEIITSFNPIRPIRPLPRRKADKTHPHIVVLGEQSHPQS